MLYVAEGYIRHVFFWLATIYLHDVIKGLVAWNRFEICTWVLNFTRIRKKLLCESWLDRTTAIFFMPQSIYTIHTMFVSMKDFIFIE